MSEDPQNTEIHSWILFGSLAQRKLKGRVGISLPGGILWDFWEQEEDDPSLFQARMGLGLQRYCSLLSGASVCWERESVPAPEEGTLPTEPIAAAATRFWLCVQHRAGYSYMLSIIFPTFCKVSSIFSHFIDEEWMEVFASWFWSVCFFSWCRYSRQSQCQVTNVKSHHAEMGRESSNRLSQACLSHL